MYKISCLNINRVTAGRKEQRTDRYLQMLGNLGKNLTTSEEMACEESQKLLDRVWAAAPEIVLAYLR
jgi:hypothetical protein